MKSGSVTGLGSATMEFGSSVGGCDSNSDGDGPIEKVPASGNIREFKAIVTNYLWGDTDVNSSKSKDGNRISCWDVSLVTNMFDAFNGQTEFNEPIGCWNTESVNTMTGMFWNAAAFNQDIFAWDVSSVTNMRGMFDKAAAFNQDINAWDISSVTTKPANSNGRNHNSKANR